MELTKKPYLTSLTEPRVLTIACRLRFRHNPTTAADKFPSWQRRNMRLRRCTRFLRSLRNLLSLRRSRRNRRNILANAVHTRGPGAWDRLFQRYRTCLDVVPHALESAVVELLGIRPVDRQLRYDPRGAVAHSVQEVLPGTFVLIEPAAWRVIVVTLTDVSHHIVCDPVGGGISWGCAGRTAGSWFACAAAGTFVAGTRKWLS